MSVRQICLYINQSTTQHQRRRVTILSKVHGFHGAINSGGCCPLSQQSEEIN